MNWAFQTICSAQLKALIQEFQFDHIQRSSSHSRTIFIFNIYRLILFNRYFDHIQHQNSYPTFVINRIQQTSQGWNASHTIKSTFTFIITKKLSITLSIDTSKYISITSTHQDRVLQSHSTTIICQKIPQCISKLSPKDAHVLSKWRTLEGVVVIQIRNLSSEKK